MTPGLHLGEGRVLRLRVGVQGQETSLVVMGDHDWTTVCEQVTVLLWLPFLPLYGWGWECALS